MRYFRSIGAHAPPPFAAARRPMMHGPYRARVTESPSHYPASLSSPPHLSITPLHLSLTPLHLCDTLPQHPASSPGHERPTSTVIGEAFPGIKNRERNRVLAIPQVDRATEPEKPQSPALDSAYALRLPHPPASFTVRRDDLRWVIAMLRISSPRTRSRKGGLERPCLVRGRGRAWQ